MGLREDTWRRVLMSPLTSAMPALPSPLRGARGPRLLNAMASKNRTKKNAASSADGVLRNGETRAWLGSVALEPLRKSGLGSASADLHVGSFAVLEQNHGRDR